MTEMKSTIKRLLKSNVPSYIISKETGVAQSRLSDLRNGKRQLENIALGTAEKLYIYQKEVEKMENTKSYVVNMVQHDKEVEIWTKEYGDYMWYTIAPEYLKNIGDMMLLIEERDLNERFFGELVDSEDVDEYDYTLKEVRDNLSYYRQKVL